MYQSAYQAAHQSAYSVAFEFGRLEVQASEEIMLLHLHNGVHTHPGAVHSPLFMSSSMVTGYWLHQGDNTTHHMLHMHCSDHANHLTLVVVGMITRGVAGISCCRQYPAECKIGLFTVTIGNHYCYCYQQPFGFQLTSISLHTVHCCCQLSVAHQCASWSQPDACWDKSDM